MDNNECKDLYQVLENSIGDILDVVNYGHYIWIFTSDKLHGIVHGGVGKPYEFKLVNVGDTKQIDYNFDDYYEFKEFLANKAKAMVLANAL